MSSALTKMYNDLTAQQKKQVYNYIFAFYKQNSENKEQNNETYGFGSLKQYANPELHKKEKNAWAIAVEEKHVVS